MTAITVIQSVASALQSAQRAQSQAKANSVGNESGGSSKLTTPTVVAIALLVCVVVITLIVILLVAIKWMRKRRAEKVADQESPMFFKTKTPTGASTQFFTSDADGGFGYSDSSNVEIVVDSQQQQHASVAPGIPRVLQARAMEGEYQFTYTTNHSSPLPNSLTPPPLPSQSEQHQQQHSHNNQRPTTPTSNRISEVSVARNKSARSSASATTLCNSRSSISSDRSPSPSSQDRSKSKSPSGERNKSPSATRSKSPSAKRNTVFNDLVYEAIIEKVPPVPSLPEGAARQLLLQASEELKQIRQQQRAAAVAAASSSNVETPSAGVASEKKRGRSRSQTRESKYLSVSSPGHVGSAKPRSKSATRPSSTGSFEDNKPLFLTLQENAEQKAKSPYASPYTSPANRAVKLNRRNTFCGSPTNLPTYYAAGTPVSPVPPVPAGFYGQPWNNYFPPPFNPMYPHPYSMYGPPPPPPPKGYDGFHPSDKGKQQYSGRFDGPVPGSKAQRHSYSPQYHMDYAAMQSTQAYYLHQQTHQHQQQQPHHIPKQTRASVHFQYPPVPSSSGFSSSGSSTSSASSHSSSSSLAMTTPKIRIKRSMARTNRNSMSRTYGRLRQGERNGEGGSGGSSGDSSGTTSSTACSGSDTGSADGNIGVEIVDAKSIFGYYSAAGYNLEDHYAT
ncbi:hypothetical protein HDU97_009591 [Phlyctochytrium planicorne]|nr:hypothetical protein HDU97_009591 [Phlyctochytrium planicorne]